MLVRGEITQQLSKPEAADLLDTPLRMSLGADGRGLAAAAAAREAAREAAAAAEAADGDGDAGEASPAPSSDEASAE